jgi:hypothetical protein
MKTTRIINVMVSVLIVVSLPACAQSKKETKQKEQTAMETMKTNAKNMNTYVIEREIPDAGKLTAEQLQGISQTSCSVLKELGSGIEWLHSYVAGNKIYCIYRAENEDILRKHAEKGGFPINTVSKLSTVISPATATSPLAEIIR